jgi:hypothetical protein
MKKEIKALVEYALFDFKNKNKSLEIGVVNKKQSEIIKQKLGVNLYGCKRILSTSAIKHILRVHGSIKGEEKRGQIAINIDDFENIPIFIANAHKVEYAGKNKLLQDVFIHTTEMDGLIIIIESVVINKHGNKVYIETMYKRQKSNRK